MSGFKCYHPALTLKQGTFVHLSKDESRHLIHVLRAKKGDPVTLFNGVDQAWATIIGDPSPKSTILLIKANIPLSPPVCPITLAQAMPKAKGMDSIIQKTTEIGISHIVPLQTARTELKLDELRQEKRLLKWQTIAREASKQSGNFLTPQVSDIQDLKVFLKNVPMDSLKFVASLEPQARLLYHYLPSTLPNAIYWLIGPEGDFTNEEYRLAHDAGFQPVSLANHVLRIETAVIYALSITDYELKRPY